MVGSITSTILLVLLLLTARSNALPIPRSPHNHGQTRPQMIGLPFNNRERPAYVRLDDVIGSPGANPDILIISEGHVLDNGSSNNDKDTTVPPADHQPKCPPSAVARIRLKPLRLVHEALLKLAAQSWQNRHGAVAEPVTPPQPPPPPPPVPEEVDLRRQVGGKNAAHHRHVHARGAMHRHGRRSKIKLYGYKHSPSRVNVAEPPELRITANTWRWKDD